MTKDEFIANLPAKIIYKDVGESQLVILIDEEKHKVASYVSGEYKIQSVVRTGDSWENLYKEMATYLKDEGHKKIGQDLNAVDSLIVPTNKKAV
jgi:hypothetical protein